MRASRGMGAVSKAKLPGSKATTVLKKGGRVKKFDEGGDIDDDEIPRSRLQIEGGGGSSKGRGHRVTAGEIGRAYV